MTDHAIPRLQFTAKLRDRIQLVATQVDDDSVHFRIAPAPPEPRLILAMLIWSLLIWALGLVMILSLSDGPLPREGLSIWGIGGLACCLLVVGSYKVFSGLEFEKGPVLEIDRVGGVVALPRVRSVFPISEVVAIGLLSGPYDFNSETDQASELSLIVATPEGALRPVAFLMQADAESASALAERVAAALNRPIDRQRLADR